jgi:hypothetical protein
MKVISLIATVHSLGSLVVAEYYANLFDGTSPPFPVLHPYKYTTPVNLAVESELILPTTVVPVNLVEDRYISLELVILPTNCAWQRPGEMVVVPVRKRDTYLLLQLITLIPPSCFSLMMGFCARLDRNYRSYRFIEVFQDQSLGVD